MCKRQVVFVYLAISLPRRLIPLFAVTTYFLAGFKRAFVIFFMPWCVLWGEQDWKEMVNDPEVGAIVVGSPTPFHAEQIIEAAKLGKHIFCEKVQLAGLT